MTSIKDLFERLNFVESKVNTLLDIAYSDLRLIKNTIPHACPICKGRTTVKWKDDDGNKIETCLPCDGNGVIWG